MIYPLGQDALIYQVRQDYIIRVTEPSGAVHISAMCNGLNSLLHFIEDGLQDNCRVEIQAVFYPSSATPKEAIVALNEEGS